MDQMQKTKKPGDPSTDDVVKGSGLKRLAPESTGLLKEIDKAVQEERQASAVKSRKRKILEQCGCL